jgi:hypothetical protein
VILYQFVTAKTNSGLAIHMNETSGPSLNYETSSENEEHWTTSCTKEGRLLLL